MKVASRPVVVGQAMAAVLALLVGGCSAAPAKPAEPPLGSVIPVRSEADIRLPLLDLELSEQEYLLLNRAAMILAQACARRFGVSGTFPMAVEPVSLRNQPRRYGLVDSETAARLGYRPTGWSKPAPNDKARGWNPGPREYLVMQGRNPGGDVPAQLPRDAAGT